MKFILIILFLTVSGLRAESKGLISYSKIDPILKETWDATIPVPYTKIVRKDIIGKGIAQIRNRKIKRLFLYSFIVYIPRYIEKEKKLSIAGPGKEITVRLYYNPSNTEKPYYIKIGEFEEKYNRRMILRYLKK